MTLCTSKHRKLICTYLSHTQKDYIINMDYVRLSANLYIHYVRLSRNLYIHNEHLSTSQKSLLDNKNKIQPLWCLDGKNGQDQDLCNNPEKYIPQDAIVNNIARTFGRGTRMQDMASYAATGKFFSEPYSLAPLWLLSSGGGLQWRDGERRRIRRGGSGKPHTLLPGCCNQQQPKLIV